MTLFWIISILVLLTHMYVFARTKTPKWWVDVSLIVANAVSIPREYFPMISIVLKRNFPRRRAYSFYKATFWVVCFLTCLVWPIFWEIFMNCDFSITLELIVIMKISNLEFLPKYLPNPNKIETSPPKMLLRCFFWYVGPILVYFPVQKVNFKIFSCCQFLFKIS